MLQRTRVLAPAIVAGSVAVETVQENIAAGLLP